VTMRWPSGENTAFSTKLVWPAAWLGVGRWPQFSPLSRHMCDLSHRQDALRGIGLSVGNF
jgi:hypothetical protein